MKTERIAVTELNQVGEARRRVGHLCDELAGDQVFRGRVSLVLTELARNLVVHAKGGELVVREIPGVIGCGLEILSIDRGPGMKDVGECLRDGYSTAGTPGTGLGAVRRLSEAFDLFTAVGQGSVICARLFRNREDVPKEDFSIGAVAVPIAGESVCGDSWHVAPRTAGARVFLADGLGHGIYAAEASQRAIQIFREHPAESMEHVLRSVHGALVSTRGAAGALADLDGTAGTVTVAGVGNISVRVFQPGGESRQLASVNGTLGAVFPRIGIFSTAWAPGSVLVVHSDGLKSNWNLDNYRGLLQRHPATIAGVLYRDFARGRDDATVVVLSSVR